MKRKFIFVCLMMMISISISIKVSAITDTIHSSINGLFAIDNNNSLWALNYYENGVYITESKKIMDNAISVSNGYVLKSDGTLYKFLDFEDDNIDEANVITPIEIMKDVKYVSSMNMVSKVGTAVIKNDNSLWIWKNDECPKKIMNNVADATGNPEFCIALKTDGSVWSFGMNDYGQLGNGSNKDSECFSKIMENVKNVEACSAGGFAFLDDDTLYRWGSINSLWIEDNILTPTTPMKYVDDAESITNFIEGAVFVKKKDGSLWCYGQSSEKELFFNLKLPCKLEIDNVCDISGTGKILILKNNGELYLKEYKVDYEYSDFNNNLEKLADNIKLPQKNVEFIKKDFTDISNKSDEMQKSIKSLSKAGIIKGSSDTTYSPDESISRAETAALLLRMTGKSNETADVEFSDVTPDKWYYSTAGVSQKYGILNGYEDNTFRGEERISKLQFVSLASRVLRDESFEDITQYEEKRNELNGIPDWAKDDINLALNSKLVDESDISGDWNEKITRGEAAVILYRLYNKI